MSGKLDRRRLAKLLGMLGSAHDGEVVAAGRQVERLRQAAGFTWGQILSSAPPSPPSQDPALRRQIGDLLAENDRLHDRVRELEARLATRPASPPPLTVPDNLDAVLCVLVTWGQHLNEYERGFVDDILRRRKRRLNPKQCGTLADIVTKVEFYRRHAGNGAAP